MRALSLWLILLIFALTACSDLFVESFEDAELNIRFKNNTPHKLYNLIVADKLIGEITPGMTTGYYPFHNFRFDSGLPDEDASCVADNQVYTNISRGYWCGTQKYEVASGKYLIEIEIRDSLLFLCAKDETNNPHL